MAPVPGSEFRAVMIGKSQADNITLCQLINGQKNIFQQKIQKHSKQSKSNPFTVELTEDVFRLPLNTVRHKMKKCVAQCHPGPNVLLLLVKASDFTEKDRQTLKFIMSLFGQEAWKHLMIIQTENDTIVNSTVNQLLQDCGHRQHTLNFDKQGFSDCIQELVDKMGDIVFATRGQYLNFTEEADVTGPECTQDKEQVSKVKVPEGNSFNHIMPPKPVPPPRRPSFSYPKGYNNRNLAGMQRMVPGRQSLRQSRSEQSASIPISRESFGKVPGQESVRVLRESTRKVKPKEPVRIVMVGKTGCGKSATGNTILGRNCFDASPCLSSVTKKCQKEEGEIGGRRITVVDTPGLFDTALTNAEIKQELGKCVSLLAPGPHVFLLVLQIGRVTREERATVDMIRKFFGKKSEDFIILLFTRGDELGGQTIESYLAEDTKGFMKNLVNECGGRYLVFENTKSARDTKKNQVSNLMNKILEVVKANDGGCYNSDMFREAEIAIQQKKQKILKDKEAEIQKEVKEVERRHQEEKREQQKRWMEREKREEEERKKKEQVEKRRGVFGNRPSVYKRFSLQRIDDLQEQEAWKQEVKVWWEKQCQEDEEREDQQELQENHEQEIKMHENKQKEDRIREEERERELKEIQQRNERELEEIRRRHEENARKQAEESNKFSEEIHKYGKEIETLKRRHQQQREKLIDQLCKNEHFKKSFTKLKNRQQQEVNEMKLTHFDDRTNLDKFLSDQKAVHEDEIDDWVEEHVNMRNVCTIL